jgi:hypothetical protein
MDAHELEQILQNELGYTEGQSMRRGDDIPWSNGPAIPDINATLFIQEHPICYFSHFSELQPDRIRQLHRNVWSQSKAPLLFVTLPHEIRIYNGYEPTPKPNERFDASPRLLRHLTKLTDHLKAQQEIRKQLAEQNHYERIYLETSEFWTTVDGQKIKYKRRADYQLIESMKQMRRLLVDENGKLSNQIAYTLLGRSIFIRYLEDRGVLTPEWIGEMTDGQVSTYRDALQSRQTTYRLFEALSGHFKGDLFPVEAAEADVNSGCLNCTISIPSNKNLLKICSNTASVSSIGRRNRPESLKVRSRFNHLTLRC